jgi:hypothetical protein
MNVRIILTGLDTRDEFIVHGQRQGEGLDLQEIQQVARQ